MMNANELVDPDALCAHENIDSDTFKQIFRDHWEAFKRQYPVYDDEYYDEVITKMLNCGDPEKMGYAEYVCMHCGETLRIAFSCKSAFCLSCAKPYTDRWVEFISRRLLPGIDYKHTVLTVPDFLRPYFKHNPQPLLDLLMKTAKLCLLDFFETATKTKLDIGCVMVLQTAGRSGKYNPHLHILVTAGGFKPDGQWKAVNFFPYKLLHRKWQFHLLTMLREHLSDPAIRRDIARGWRDYPKGFVAWVDRGKVPEGGKGLAKYLAKYLVSPPISVRRIDRYDGHSVTYWFRDHKTEQIQTVTLPVLQFIERMVQHILPKGFQRIRYYGLHANVRYQKAREAVERIRPQAQPTPALGYRVIPRITFPQLFENTFGYNPLTCPRCNSGMELASINHPDYGVIKDYWNTLWISDEEPDDAQQPYGADPSTRPGKRMVQIPLPFM